MKRNQHTFFILLISCISFITSCYAQESIVVSGGTATGTGGSSSYSIGQVVYTGAAGGKSGYVVQGVQQPYEIIALGNKEFTEIKLVMTAYPNPTIDVLNLEVTDNKWENLSFTLFDSTGKAVASKSKITASQTQLSMREFNKGIYLLSVTDRNKTVKTFKIIKK